MQKTRKRRLSGVTASQGGIIHIQAYDIIKFTWWYLVHNTNHTPIVMIGSSIKILETGIDYIIGDPIQCNSQEENESVAYSQAYEEVKITKPEQCPNPNNTDSESIKNTVSTNQSLAPTENKIVSRFIQKECNYTPIEDLVLWNQNFVIWGKIVDDFPSKPMSGQHWKVKNYEFEDIHSHVRIELCIFDHVVDIFKDTIRNFGYYKIEKATLMKNFRKRADFVTHALKVVLKEHTLVTEIQSIPVSKIDQHKFNTIEELDQVGEGSYVSVIGQVEYIRTSNIARGPLFSFTITDHTVNQSYAGETTGYVYPLWINFWEPNTNISLIEEGAIVMVLNGKKVKKDKVLLSCGIGTSLYPYDQISHLPIVQQFQGPSSDIPASEIASALSSELGNSSKFTQVKDLIMIGNGSSSNNFYQIKCKIKATENQLQTAVINACPDWNRIMKLNQDTNNWDWSQWGYFWAEPHLKYSFNWSLEDSTGVIATTLTDTWAEEHFRVTPEVLSQKPVEDRMSLHNLIDLDYIAEIWVKKFTKNLQSINKYICRKLSREEDVYIENRMQDLHL